MHVQPMNHVLKAPGSMLLTLRYDGPLSKFAFKFNLCHYTEAVTNIVFAAVAGSPLLILRVTGGGLHSSTFHLNLSRF